MLSGLQKAVPGPPIPLELLAHYEVANAQTGSARSGFAMILALSDRLVRLEGDVALDEGDDMEIRFFLPDATSTKGRMTVTLQCSVSHCIDTTKLHYDASITRIGRAAVKAIRDLRPGGTGEVK